MSTTTTNKTTTQVLLCGGGNAIHVLTRYIGSNDKCPDCEVRILSLFPGEADRLTQALGDEGVCCQNDLGKRDKRDIR